MRAAGAITRRHAPNRSNRVHESRTNAAARSFRRPMEPDPRRRRFASERSTTRAVCEASGIRPMPSSAARVKRRRGARLDQEFFTRSSRSLLPRAVRREAASARPLTSIGIYFEERDREQALKRGGQAQKRRSTSRQPKKKNFQLRVARFSSLRSCSSALGLGCC